MAHDKNLINKYLNKIISSRHFVRSKISSDLLVYLTEASLLEKNPKEYTIGVELFGKKYDDGTKQDANIRVYIHTVRKKLEDYYKDEGRKDPVVFVIEKGKYKVRFETPKKRRKTVKYVFLVPFLVTLAALAFVSFHLVNVLQKQENKWKKLPVWQEFAANGNKTLLVLGDYFVFSGMLPTGNVGIYRDFNINSEVDYEYLLDKNPQLVQILSKSNLTYLSKMSAFCQSNIYKVFSQTGADIDIKLSSDVQPSDLKNNNIIFVGNYKNMGIFENIVKEMNFSFGVSSGSNQFILSDDSGSEIYTPANTAYKEVDYALVINTQGYANNRFLFFLSTQDIGNISVVNQLTNPGYLEKFAMENLQTIDPKNFKALYKVEGINKTDLSFELIRVE